MRQKYPLVMAILATLASEACMTFGDGGVSVEGVVTDPAGAPIAGALVYLDHPRRADYPTVFETTTSDSGHFRLSATVAPGHYRILLIIEAFNPHGWFFVKLPTLTDNVLCVVLAPAGSSVKSRAILTERAYASGTTPTPRPCF